MTKLIVLSGPSCVGKGSLTAALCKFYPELACAWEKLVLYNSRPPRPGERDGADYHFRERSVIEEFRKKEHYLTADIRGDLQAIDLLALEEQLKKSDVFFEGNPMIVQAFRELPLFKKTEMFSVFLSPLSREEVEFLKQQTQQVDMLSLVTDVMRRKLLRRTQKQKTHLSLKDLDDIERRAGSALSEMKYAWMYDAVIPNHDGEDSEHWDAFYWPLGDAQKTLECFAALLKGLPHPLAEKWNPPLLG